MHGGGLGLLDGLVLVVELRPRHPVLRLLLLQPLLQRLQPVGQVDLLVVLLLQRERGCGEVVAALGINIDLKRNLLCRDHLAPLSHFEI